MNQKYCRNCPYLDLNEISDEMYCKLKDFEQIRLGRHKHRPDWCPLVCIKTTKAMPLATDCISRQDAVKTALEFFVEFYGGAFDEKMQRMLLERMNGLSSAQPEQKKGESE